MKVTVKFVPQRRQRRIWKNRGWKWRGAGVVAQQLGVTREHLYLVLEGKRTSPRLLAAAQQLLKATQTKPTGGTK